VGTLTVNALMNWVKRTDKRKSHKKQNKEKENKKKNPTHQKTSKRLGERSLTREEGIHKGKEGDRGRIKLLTNRLGLGTSVARCIAWGE